MAGSIAITSEIKKYLRGGVIRDAQGNWIMGFEKNLGYGLPTTADIHAIASGL